MNFKRAKPKEKKLIDYGTPKYIQISAQKPLHSIPGLRKYPCKKRKGEHVFVSMGSHEFMLFKWEDYQCTACGKKKVRSKLL